MYRGVEGVGEGKGVGQVRGKLGSEEKRGGWLVGGGVGGLGWGWGWRGGVGWVVWVEKG